MKIIQNNVIHDESWVFWVLLNVGARDSHGLFYYILPNKIVRFIDSYQVVISPL